jgi:MFS transporter, PAT family, beta-lactamase induction signal transducer AmpG
MGYRASTAPVTFLFLALPYGLGAGFCELWIPFALTRAGFPVALTASIVAVGIAANVLRFIYAPVIDATLTLRQWYLIGLASCVVLTIVLGLMPFVRDAAAAVMVVVFLCQVSTTLVMNPVGALMATTVNESMKGRAAGWCQAGNQGGKGLAGLAIWVSTHFSNGAAGILLGVIMGTCALGLVFVGKPSVRVDQALGTRLLALGKDVLAMARNPTSLLIIVLCASPIGVGAASAIWPAVAAEWAASPDRVALDTGILSAIVSTAGSVAGGQVADRLGRWWAYFGSGLLLALIAVGVIASARTPLSYDLGVLGYAFFTAMGVGAWCALVLYATGRTAVATKYAALASIGNLPNAYMTWLDGWIHDKYGVAAMFGGEALIAVLCIVLGLLVLKMIGTDTARPRTPALEIAS